MATQNPIEQEGTYPLPEAPARPLPDARLRRATRKKNPSATSYAPRPRRRTTRGSETKPDASRTGKTRATGHLRRPQRDPRSPHGRSRRELHRRPHPGHAHPRALRQGPAEMDSNRRQPTRHHRARQVLASLRLAQRPRFPCDPTTCRPSRTTSFATAFCSATTRRRKASSRYKSSTGS